ncbi:hypothetical protein H920_02428 [Fukomys damarensis]|uniref:Uncharacterized protein n=1 Tax=Fukomys damarensis TaxID=885580 RepID=A0A091EKZ4_FUKDA|nr:hypothetical protein H920_02428 [Fukomys damarensis]
MPQYNFKDLAGSYTQQAPPRCSLTDCLVSRRHVFVLKTPCTASPDQGQTGQEGDIAGTRVDETPGKAAPMANTKPGRCVSKTSPPPHSPDPALYSVLKAKMAIKGFLVHRRTGQQPVMKEEMPSCPSAEHSGAQCQPGTLLPNPDSRPCCLGPNIPLCQNHQQAPVFQTDGGTNVEQFKQEWSSA